MAGKLLNGRPGLEKEVNLIDKIIQVTWINPNIKNGGRLVLVYIVIVDTCVPVHSWTNLV
jgi:hypothetical protein